MKVLRHEMNTKSTVCVAVNNFDIIPDSSCIIEASDEFRILNKLLLNCVHN